jgi:hypothetical protein
MQIFRQGAKTQRKGSETIENLHRLVAATSRARFIRVHLWLTSPNCQLA